MIIVSKLSMDDPNTNNVSFPISFEPFLHNETCILFHSMTLLGTVFVYLENEIYLIRKSFNLIACRHDRGDLTGIEALAGNDVRSFASV